VTLPKASTDQLIEKFGEIWLSNNSVGFDFGSTSNLTLTSTWVELHELAPEPSFGPTPPRAIHVRPLQR
jgi:hypothetical protein